MSEFDLVDCYRKERISVSAEQISSRMEAFEAVGAKLSPKNVPQILRIYFNLKNTGDNSWFVDAFRKTDPTFSMVENEREAAVLAGGLLAAAIANRKMYAAMGVLACSLGGAREPMVAHELVQVAQAAAAQFSVEKRQQADLDSLLIKIPGRAALATEIGSLTSTQDFSVVAGSIKRVNDDLSVTAKSIIRESNRSIGTLSSEVVRLREEVNLLWWHIGGWSRIKEKPFSEFELSVAALLIGLDVADLSETATGPFAAPALMQRMVSLDRDVGSEKASIFRAISGLSLDDSSSFSLSDRTSELIDICPVLGALSKAIELEDLEAWKGPFFKASEVDPNIEFQPWKLALQVFRERIFVASMD